MEQLSQRLRAIEKTFRRAARGAGGVKHSFFTFSPLRPQSCVVLRYSGTSRVDQLPSVSGSFERIRLRLWRRGAGSNRRIKVLQTSALPLGYRAVVEGNELQK